MQQRFRYAIAALMFTVSVFVIFLWIPDPADFATSTDWGFQLAGATNILHGEHPFVDFHANYGPLTYYASALGQIISGQRPIGEVILATLGYATAYCIIFWLAWSISRRVSVAFPILLVALINLPRYYKYYIVLGPALSLFAIWYYIDHKNWRALLLLGFSVAVTGLFRQDIGAYLVLTVGAVILLDRETTFDGRVKELLKFGISVVVCALPWLIFALMRGGLGTYFYDSTFAAYVGAESLRRPLPFFDPLSLSALLSRRTVTVFTYLTAFALPSIALLVIVRGRGFAEPIRCKAFSTSLLSILMLGQFLQLAEYNHLLQAIPIQFVLVAFLIGHGLDYTRSKTDWYRRLAFMGLGSVIAIVGILNVRIGIASLSDLSPRPICCERPLFVLSIYAQPIEEFLSVAAASKRNLSMLLAEKFVLECAQKEEPILAWPNLTIVYFMTNHPSFGQVMTIGPGYYDSPEDQARLIEEISDSDQLNLIVLRPNTSFRLDENRIVQANTDIINNYLDKEFVPIQELGEIVILVRKDALSNYANCFNSPSTG